MSRASLPLRYLRLRLNPYGSAKELKASRTELSKIREQMARLKEEANHRARVDKKPTGNDKPPLMRTNNGANTASGGQVKKDQWI